MSETPEELRYTKSHEWIRREEDGTITIGVTDHAQDLLGDLVYVELPEAGRSMEAGEEFAVVESVKAASDVYCPVTGEVLEVNEALADSPELINSAPFEDGWMVRLKPKDMGDVDKLMSSDEYIAAQSDED